MTQRFLYILSKIALGKTLNTNEKKFRMSPTLFDSFKKNLNSDLDEIMHIRVWDALVKNTINSLQSLSIFGEID